MISTHLKNIRQIGSFPQIGVKIKNVWVATTEFSRAKMLVFKGEGVEVFVSRLQECLVLDTLSSKIWWASSTYQCRCLDAEVPRKKENPQRWKAYHFPDISHISPTSKPGSFTIRNAVTVCLRSMVDLTQVIPVCGGWICPLVQSLISLKSKKYQKKGWGELPWHDTKRHRNSVTWNGFWLMMLSVRMKGQSIYGIV